MSRYGVNSLLSCASNNYYYKIVSYVIHMIIFFFLLLFKDGPSVKQSKDGPYTMEYTGKLGGLPLGWDYYQTLVNYKTAYNY